MKSLDIPLAGIRTSDSCLETKDIMPENVRRIRFHQVKSGHRKMGLILYRSNTLQPCSLGIFDSKLEQNQDITT